MHLLKEIHIQIKILMLLSLKQLSIATSKPVTHAI